NALRERGPRKASVFRHGFNVLGLRSRAPRGARGLKQGQEPMLDEPPKSRPARGAWIETTVEYSDCQNNGSRPARGAWIETGSQSGRSRPGAVAPRAGRVD